MSCQTTANDNTARINSIINENENENDNDDDDTNKQSIRIARDLKDFYKSHNLDLTAVLKQQKSDTESPFPYRFVRLNPRFDRNETLQLLEKEIQSKPVVVSWVGEEWGFYALPPNCSLASSDCFKNGRIYGMDVSSGAGTAALFSDIQQKQQQKKEEGTTTTTSILGDKEEEIRVLDLCCCPGLKLCAMADFWKTQKNSNAAVVVGVDISQNRMALCKKIVQKYHIDKETSGTTVNDGDDESITALPPICNIQLYCQDGTTFGVNKNDNNLVFDSRVAMEDAESRGGKRKRMNKSARARERKRLRQLENLDWMILPSKEEEKRKEEDNDKEPSTTSIRQEEDNPNATTTATSVSSIPQIKPFDYVLVDAECSTDGSLKHMRERLKEKPEQQEANTLLTDKQQLADLVDLQKRLLASGFRLLKPGGVLVYSTCSLSYEQNEGVVEWLLKEQKDDSYIINVEFPETSSSKLVVEGSVEGTLRFYPNLIGQADDSLGLYGDGFFLAKIGKRLS